VFTVADFVSATSGSMKVMPPIFFSENVIAVAMKFTWMIHISFEIMRLFFHKVAIFNMLLPTLKKVLHTIIVKFPVSTSEYIMKTLFQFVVICTMVFT
jgi:hypothetical protein